MNKDLGLAVQKFDSILNPQEPPLSRADRDAAVLFRTNPAILQSLIFPHHCIHDKFFRFKVLVEEPFDETKYEDSAHVPEVASWLRKMKYLYSELHVAIEIGATTLHFLKHGMVEVRTSQAGTHVRLLYSADVHDLGQIPNTDFNRKIIADTVVKWNMTKIFHPINCNSQHFVEDLYSALKLQFIASNLLSDYVEYCNVNNFKGYCIAEREKGILKPMDYNGSELIFETHNLLHSKIPLNDSLLDMTHPYGMIFAKAICRGLSSRGDTGGHGCLFGVSTLTTDRRPGDPKVYANTLQKMTQLMQIRIDNQPRLDRSEHIGPINILSLDGRGLRGLAILKVLARVEEVLEKRIFEMFDMITGNGIGGLVALCLVHMKMSANEILNKYKIKAIELYGSYSKDETNVRPNISNEILYRSLQDVIRWMVGDFPITVVQYPKVSIACSNEQDFYSFRNFGDLDSTAGTTKCYISDVAMAAVSSPPYLDSVEINGHQYRRAQCYSDKLVADEIKLAFPDRQIKIHLILGSGHLDVNIDNEAGLSSNEKWLLHDCIKQYSYYPMLLNSSFNEDNRVVRFDPVLPARLLISECDTELTDAAVLKHLNSTYGQYTRQIDHMIYESMKIDLGNSALKEFDEQASIQREKIIKEYSDSCSNTPMPQFMDMAQVKQRKIDQGDREAKFKNTLAEFDRQTKANRMIVKKSIQKPF